ncbi:BsuBI/PstI family type II restriction endonuclease [Burkholderia pseudomallei]|uniref:BsuBI/PstI family type II restriction endonuclease n=1 Tax=Burkholderia pseudomallei TaxID=28450 RepID=UPI0018C4B767|nr:BsuBI/PstI family type II restriction endonuclease [Burkholderia pseudomallei]MBG1252523.1 restriction endonuclease [Burkholderia pseudomallei]
MSLPALLPIAEIQARLLSIFPAGLEMRGPLTREMAAKTIWVFLYGGMVEGQERLLRPSHVYFYTEDQALLTDDDERLDWVKSSRRPGFRPNGVRWYADTTREPIRDETIRLGFLDIGAVGKILGVATTSSKPIYYLKEDFAALFDPGLTDEALTGAVDAWQKKHLSPAARARMALLAAGKIKRTDQVEVACPDGAIVKLEPGLSSLISKGVVEEFAKYFVENAALLWLSESGAKVSHQDDVTAKSLGLNIDASKVLPDIILANVGESGDDTALIFIEVVASDGPMNQGRKDALLAYVRKANFPEEQCYFGTAFEDRADSAFKKAVPTLAWGSFIWFRSEPERLMWLHSQPFDIAKDTNS